MMSGMNFTLHAVQGNVSNDKNVAHTGRRFITPPWARGTQTIDDMGSTNGIRGARSSGLFQDHSL